MKKWPTYGKTVKLRMDCDIVVDATVDLDGRCIVALTHDNAFSEPTNMHPAEAERLGRALLDAAACARAKKKASRGGRAPLVPGGSTPLMVPRAKKCVDYQAYSRYSSDCRNCDGTPGSHK